MKLRKDDLIEVDWIDAHGDAAWKSEDDARKTPPEVYVRSVGYYLRSSPELIFMSQTISKERKGDRDQHVIPRGTIKKIKKLYRRK